MNKHLNRFAAVMLVLGVATLLVFASTYLSAYAQEGAGDQLRAQVTPLISEGEGENRKLTSGWKTVAANERHVYRFDYTGSDQPIRVSMESAPAPAVQFQIWTEELVTALNDDPELAPLDVGEPISDGSQFSVWDGNSPASEIYYVAVRATGADPGQYLLEVTSPGLALEQPGIGPQTPISPTATLVPTMTTPTEAAPTQTVPTQAPPTQAVPTQGVPAQSVPTAIPTQALVVPAATANPNVAVVSAPALNVRSGPSTAYPVITTVPAGTVVTVLGRNEINTWIAVRLEDGTQGWVTRSLTNYVGLATIVLTPEPLPLPTPIPGVTATATPSTMVVVAQAPSPEALDGGWKVIREGETHWYTIQYRGGGLPVHVWMDVEPDQGAVFNILSQETALTILAGVAPTVVNAIGRGSANPVEPGYQFWRADFPEADILYVMVQHEGPGDVVYSIHAAGPGLSRPVPQ
jgi:uncharacterized protein YraI